MLTNGPGARSKAKQLLHKQTLNKLLTNIYNIIMPLNTDTALVSRPIAERVSWLFNLASTHSASFSTPASYLSRTRYRAHHRTQIIALKCMDGRINLAVATNTPPGIIVPIRNLGGRFNLGWPHLGEVLVEAVNYAVDQGRGVLVISSYHFSKGDVHRGCAGFEYDTEAAMRHMFELKAQMNSVFGGGDSGPAGSPVYPIVVGFETDEEALILHGESGTLNMAEIADCEPERDSLLPKLAALYPDMDPQMLSDLIPLLLGNLDHIAQLRLHPRPLDTEHREWMICIGRGFDWLHTNNTALIVGPYSPDLGDPIRKAAGIIASNMQSGRIPSDGFLLLASAPYDQVGVDRERAVLKAKFMREFAGEVIAKEFPELAEKMIVSTCVMNWGTRRLEVIEGAEKVKTDGVVDVLA